MANFGASCSTRYTAAHHNGPRQPREKVLWVVLHGAESPTAASTARYLASDAANGSAHLVVDDHECYRLLPDAIIAWGAPGANTNGVHIEQAGFARWGAATWLLHKDTIRRAACKAAQACYAHGVPPIFRTWGSLQRRMPGVTTHAEVTRAFGGTHHDPGRFWPRQLFMRELNDFYDRLVS